MGTLEDDLEIRALHLLGAHVLHELEGWDQWRVTYLQKYLESPQDSSSRRLYPVYQEAVDRALQRQNARSVLAALERHAPNYPSLLGLAQVLRARYNEEQFVAFARFRLTECLRWEVKHSDPLRRHLESWFSKAGGELVTAIESVEAAEHQRGQYAKDCKAALEAAKVNPDLPRLCCLSALPIEPLADTTARLLQMTAAAHDTTRYRTECAQRRQEAVLRVVARTGVCERLGLWCEERAVAHPPLGLADVQKQLKDLVLSELQKELTKLGLGGVGTEGLLKEGSVSNASLVQKGMLWNEHLPQYVLRLKQNKQKPKDTKLSDETAFRTLLEILVATARSDVLAVLLARKGEERKILKAVEEHLESYMESVVRATAHIRSSLGVDFAKHILGINPGDEDDAPNIRHSTLWSMATKILRDRLAAQQAVQPSKFVQAIDCIILRALAKDEHGLKRLGEVANGASEAAIALAEKVLSLRERRVQGRVATVAGKREDDDLWLCAFRDVYCQERAAQKALLQRAAQFTEEGLNDILSLPAKVFEEGNEVVVDWFGEQLPGVVVGRCDSGGVALYSVHFHGGGEEHEIPSRWIRPAEKEAAPVPLRPKTLQLPLLRPTRELSGHSVEQHSRSALHTSGNSAFMPISSNRSRSDGFSLPQPVATRSVLRGGIPIMEREDELPLPSSPKSAASTLASFTPLDKGVFSQSSHSQVGDEEEEEEEGEDESDDQVGMDGVLVEECEAAEVEEGHTVVVEEEPVATVVEEVTVGEEGGCGSSALEEGDGRTVGVGGSEGEEPVVVDDAVDGMGLGAVLVAVDTDEHSTEPIEVEEQSLSPAPVEVVGGKAGRSKAAKEIPRMDEPAMVVDEHHPGPEEQAVVVEEQAVVEEEQAVVVEEQAVVVEEQSVGEQAVSEEATADDVVVEEQAVVEEEQAVVVEEQAVVVEEQAVVEEEQAVVVEEQAVVEEEQAVVVEEQSVGEQAVSEEEPTADEAVVVEEQAVVVEEQAVVVEEEDHSTALAAEPALVEQGDPLHPVLPVESPKAFEAPPIPPVEVEEVEEVEETSVGGADQTVEVEEQAIGFPALPVAEEEPKLLEEAVEVLGHPLDNFSEPKVAQPIRVVPVEEADLEEPTKARGLASLFRQGQKLEILGRCNPPVYGQWKVLESLQQVPPQRTQQTRGKQHSQPMRRTARIRQLEQPSADLSPERGSDPSTDPDANPYPFDTPALPGVFPQKGVRNKRPADDRPRSPRPLVSILKKSGSAGKGVKRTRFALPQTCSCGLTMTYVSAEAMCSLCKTLVQQEYSCPKCHVSYCLECTEQFKMVHSAGKGSGGPPRCYSKLCRDCPLCFSVCPVCCPEGFEKNRAIESSFGAKKAGGLHRCRDHTVLYELQLQDQPKRKRRKRAKRLV